MIDLSRPDWADRLKAGRSLLPDLTWTPEGDRAVAVFNKLRLADVPGTPTMAEAGGDWFRDIVRAIFGAPLDPRTKERLVRELLLLVPKKNSKTTNGALLMLTALLLNLRPRATLILTAPVQDVTELAFNAAAGAIALDPVLDKKLHVREHLKTIVHRETKAELQIMTFDPAVLTGQKPVAVLVDELHVIAKSAKAASAIRQLRGGMLPFPEAFMAFITTQSEEAPSGVFAAELAKARAIRDGTQIGAMLPVLYEFPPEMQRDQNAWRDSANWSMVTPNAGRSVRIERLEQEFHTAQATGEHELRAWASQHLNVEIGLALLVSGWVGGTFWASRAEKAFSLEDLLARCEVVVVGIDGGGLDDLLGAAVVGRETKTGRWLVWVHAWAHEIVLERRKSEAARFRDFQSDGDLTIVDRIGDDIEQVVHVVQQCENAKVLDRVGVDPAGVDSIVEALTDPNGTLKLTPDRIVGIPQGWRLTGVIKTFERKLAAPNELAHGDTRLMAWCVGNARVEARGNAILITKAASGTAKIDPLMAVLDAAALMAMNPKPRRPKFQVFAA